MASPAPSDVGVIAHRGASRDRPENSIAAFDEALRQGCDAIELDVQLSRDGVPVVYHDRTLARAGGGRRRVAGLDLDELRELRLPTLDQVLDGYARRCELLVEIKIREGVRGRDRHFELAHKVAGMLRSARIERRVRVLCFDFEVLDELARIAPRLRRVLNLVPPSRVGRKLARRLESLHAVSANVRSLTPRFGAAIREAGLPLFVFTCNTRQRVELALRAGATGIMSDRPGWLAGQLAERPPR